MGTRNLTMVISGGKTKVAQYCQWDGYPQGQGKTALAFLLGCDLKKFKEKIDALSFLTNAEIEKFDKLSDKELEKNYEYLSRDTGAKILGAICDGKLEVSDGYEKKKTIDVSISKLVNSESFVADSLFCEWCYVIDLDKNTFEVYKGFNKRKLGKSERFHYMEAILAKENEAFRKKREADKKKGDKKMPKNKYHPVRFLKSWSLNKLPTQQQFYLHFASKEDKAEYRALMKATKLVKV